VLDEYVLQHASRVAAQDTAFTQAPEPLLPNYGIGRIREYALDMAMMNLVNSKERTLEEFVELGEKAGLKFVKLWTTSEMSLVEFRHA
jgi:hypothetical protein